MGAPMKVIKCREHGGTFMVEARRGRPPVRCTDRNPCNHASAPPTDVRKPSRVERAASKIKKTHMATEEVPSTHSAQSEAAQPRMSDNSSLALAKAAKVRLENTGWTCRGRVARSDVQLLASRGSETIVLIWQNGALVSQQYSFWDTDSRKNHAPTSQLDFDPAETTDGELVRRLSGMKITWWNSLAQSEESAVVPDSSKSRFSITHVYVGNGDEDNTKRVLTFIDRDGTGFRSVHVDSLISIG